MRKVLITLMAVVLVGAALLYASDSWNGFTLTATCQENGGGAHLNFPALSAGDTAFVEITVYYNTGPPGDDSGIRVGPSSAGRLGVGHGTAGEREAIYVDAHAYCKKSGSSADLYDTDYY